MVQRYVYNSYYGECAPDGEYVKYEDYAELELKFNTLREWRAKILNEALEAVTATEKAEAELQKYKDQFPDYVECANCGSVTHVEGVE